MRCTIEAEQSGRGAAEWIDLELDASPLPRTVFTVVRDHSQLSPLCRPLGYSYEVLVHGNSRQLVQPALGQFSSSLAVDISRLSTLNGKSNSLRHVKDEVSRAHVQSTSYSPETSDSSSFIDILPKQRRLVTVRSPSFRVPWEAAVLVPGPHHLSGVDVRKAAAGCSCNTAARCYG